MRTTLADELVCVDSVEEVLHDLLLFRSLNKVLDPVDQHVEEFIDVFLDHRVNWRSVDVFKRHAKLFGVEILLFVLH